MKKNVTIFLFLLLAACQPKNSTDGSGADKQKHISKTVQKVDIKLDGFVIDEVGILSENQIVDLSSSLEKFYKLDSIEILIIITPSYKNYGNEQI